MEPEDAAAGVRDVESLLPDDLAEVGAALAGNAQRGGVTRSNEGFAKELQQRLAARNGKRCDVMQGYLWQPNVKKPRLGPEMDETGNRQCVACGTIQTPKWRCGMTLCNACGVRDNRRHAKVRPPPRNPGKIRRASRRRLGHFFFSESPRRRRRPV